MDVMEIHHFGWKLSVTWCNRGQGNTEDTQFYTRCCDLRDADQFETGSVNV